MTAAGSSPFSAADSAVGYLYQVRTALLWALRRVKAGSDFVVSLETLDDVTFETRGGEPDELPQTKHHRHREAALTDARPYEAEFLSYRTEDGRPPVTVRARQGATEDRDACPMAGAG